MCTLLWDYPAAACVFFVLHSCRPLGARLASHFFQAGRRGSRPETEFIGFAVMRTQTGSRWTWRKRLN